MSEAPDSVPATFNENLALSVDQTAAMRAQWVELGLDAAEFDRAASGAPQTAPEAGPEGLEREGLTSLKQPTLSPAEALSMGEEMIRAGMDPAKVDEALKADGYAFSEDERTEEELEFDRAFGGVRPDEYHLDYQGRIPAGLDLAKVAAANTEMTAWLSAAAFPQEIGPAVLEQAMDSGQACAAMSAPERQLWEREQHATFAKMAGTPERAVELLDFAAVVLARGGDAFSNALAKSGALDDAGVLMHLAHQGERLAARGAK
jgi:hypothetical protein